MSRTLRQLVVFVALALALVALPAAVGAATPPPTLTGERLASTSLHDYNAFSCNDPNGTNDGIFIDRGGTFRFRATGTATGPYPGPFDETGSVSIAPDGTLTAFTAAFTITSPVGQVTGTKTLTGGTGFCRVSNTVQATAQTTYEATILTPEGFVYTDSGTSTTFADIGSPITQTTDFVETFVSTHPATTFLAGPTLTLTPAAAVNPVGTSHTVTASALNGLAQPMPGVTVRFAVTGATNTTGSCTTNASGQCSFTYQGPTLPGADLISAYADADNDNSADPGEPVAEATKAWVLPATTPGQVTGGGQIAAPGGLGSITFGFNAQSTDKGVKGVCTVIDQATDTKIKCLDVTAVVQSGTHATFFGNAEVNGVLTTYRIDVDDLGEPGKGRDTFAIQTASGYSAGGVLTQGNIQIHKP